MLRRVAGGLREVNNGSLLHLCKRLPGGRGGGRSRLPVTEMRPYVNLTVTAGPEMPADEEAFAALVPTLCGKALFFARYFVSLIHIEFFIVIESKKAAS